MQPRTLTWWRWKLRADRAVEGRLLPVIVRPSGRTSTVEGVELRIRDVAMRFGSDTDVAYVAALVDALR